MNFLAHLYLSRTSPALMVGNFIADGVKGKAFGQYPTAIAKGILMHRAIDTFTDQHPIVTHSKALLWPAYGKYAAVLVDIFYDYFLAKNWKEYHKQTLPVFAKETYRMLEEYQPIFPERPKRFYQYMVEYDILSNYASLNGIQQALNGMSRRAAFVSNMEKATKELKLYEPEFETHFKAFFPELEKHVNVFL